MREIYFDNAATTKVDPAAAQAALRAMLEDYGNPSSMHEKGAKAFKILEEAREAVAKMLCCEAQEIYFTSGASESNAIAIVGFLKQRRQGPQKIITTKLEHKSVLNCAKEAQKLGFCVKYLEPEPTGEFLPEKLKAIVDENTALVSIMHVNNETGAIYDIEGLLKATKQKNKNTLFHCDAAQSFGKLPISLAKLKVDMLSFSGHKLHAPKGVGGLFLKKGVKACLIEGGAQELGVRMGTENTPGIAGLGAVCQAQSKSRILEEAKKVAELKGRLTELLTRELPNVVFNSPANSSPYILNFSVLGVPAQVIQNCLQAKGVFVSTGSACAKNLKSHVLKALGLEAARINSALRVSFSAGNSEEETVEFVKILKAALNELQV